MQSANHGNTNGLQTHFNAELINHQNANGIGNHDVIFNLPSLKNHNSNNNNQYKRRRIYMGN